MSLLYFLESLRFPALNKFMLLITQLGEETAFLTESISGHRAVELSGSLQVLARMRVLE